MLGTYKHSGPQPGPQILLNNIAYYHGHRQTTQKAHSSDPARFLEEGKILQVIRKDGVISLLMLIFFFFIFYKSTVRT